MLRRIIGRLLFPDLHQLLEINMATMTEHAAKLQALTDRGERLMARVEAILDRGASETSAEVDAAVERAEAAMQQAEAMLDAAEAAG